MYYMASKKLTTSKEKYNYLIKRYYSDFVVSKGKTKENLLFERSLNAILELQECEETYLKDKKTDIDFEFYHRTLEDLEKWDGIKNESQKEFFELNINEHVELNNYEKCDNSDFLKKDKDNSNLYLEPILNKYKKNKFTNRIVGINLKLKSQLGYIINFKELGLEQLKNLQNGLQKCIEKIENDKNIIMVKGFGEEFTFEAHTEFFQFPEDVDFRTGILRFDHKMPEYYEVSSVDRDKWGDETWHVKFIGTEINVIGYPCNFTFLTKEKFIDPKKDNVLRNELLQSKLGEKYYIKNVITNAKGEEWHITFDGVEVIDLNNSFKISIKGYPDTFSFTVFKKFKPFDNDDFEADDDGRSEILLIKMYELKVKSISHAYEDYVIERVRKVKGGEEWILGS